MEEWVGGLWHKYITRKASTDYPDAKVDFTEVNKSVGVVFRALGGDLVKRVEAATSREYLVRRSLLQKISGENQQISLAWQDEESLRLPECLAVFKERSLNRDLYIWLAVLAAQHSGRISHWANDNQAMVVKVLALYPALRTRYNRLAQAFINSRPDISKLPANEQAMESAIAQAIFKPGTVSEFPKVNYAPKAVYLWLYPSAHVDPLLIPEYVDQEEGESEQQNSKKKEKIESSRKKLNEQTTLTIVKA